VLLRGGGGELHQRRVERELGEGVVKADLEPDDAAFAAFADVAPSSGAEQPVAASAPAATAPPDQARNCLREAEGTA
jgi:hypothetical protein